MSFSTRSLIGRFDFNLICGAIALTLAGQVHATTYEWIDGEYIAVGLPNPLGAGDVVNATGSGSKSFGASVTNNGLINWQSTSSASFSGSNSVFHNNGFFDFWLDSTLLSAGSSNTFDNAGTLRKSGGTGNLVISAALMNRSGGVLDAASGNIRYQREGVLEAGTVFAGTGRHEFATSLSYTFGGPFSVDNDNLYFESGKFVNGGPNRLDPATNLNWRGGTLQGSWGTAAGRTLLAVGDGAKLFANDYTNDGTVAWTSSANVLTSGNTTIFNNGTFDISQDINITATAAGNVFDNAGTLRKSGGTGNLVISAALMNRSGGVLDAASGNIRYQREGVLEADTVFAGTGRHEFATSLSYTFGGPFSVDNDNLYFESGKFVNGGPNRLDPATNLNWRGGTLQGSWGTAAGRTLLAVGDGAKLFANDYTNDGTVAWTSSANVLTSGNTTIFNNGTFDISQDINITATAAGNVFDNAGTLRKSGGTGNLVISAALMNRSGGVLDAASGNIRYQREGVLEAGTVFAGTGRHEFATSLSYTFGGPFSVDNDNLYFESGKFVNGGPNRLDPATNLNWRGGTLQGSWGTAAGRTLLAVGDGAKLFANDYTNDGTVAWTSSANVLTSGNTTIFNNGTFDISQDINITATAAGSVFANAGVLRKSGGTGDLMINTALANTGAIESLSGNIRLPSNWHNDGTLRGTAAFEANLLTNAGTIAPGLAGAPNAADLTLTGDLLQDTAGLFSFDVGGGGLSDLLLVSGGVTFAGQVLVRPLAGYSPQIGDNFLVMTFDSYTGSLADVVEVGFGAGVQFAALYSENALNLQVTAVPEPSTWAMLIAGMGLLGYRVRQRGAARQRA